MGRVVGGLLDTQNTTQNSLIHNVLCGVVNELDRVLQMQLQPRTHPERNNLRARCSHPL